MSNADGSPKRRTTAARLVWLAIIGLLVMVLADSHSVSSKVDLTVVYVVDVSDSISNPEKLMDYVFGLVEQRSSKNLPDWHCLIVFGKHAAVELPTTNSFPFERVDAQVDRGGTNLEQAVSRASAVIKPDSLGRIIVISDGVQTAGDVSSVLPELKSRKIPVDVLPVEYSYDNEVWLEGIELPQQADVGETYDVFVRLSSLSAGIGSLSLSSEGYVIATRKIDFQPGENRFSLPVTISSEGYQEYTATIDVPSRFDHVPQNNAVQDFIHVGAQGKILIVTGNSAENLDASIFETAIRKAGHKVDTIASGDLPSEARLLIPYDAIIFCNVAAHGFSQSQLAAVCDAVKDSGTGFLMTGGQNSFAPGGYAFSPIKQMLPVSIDILVRDLSKGALVIVLDNCNIPEADTWAKRITKQAIHSLDPENEVGVIASSKNDDPKWLIHLTSVTNYEQISQTINGATIENLYSFRRALEMALERFQQSESTPRHILILSDGNPTPPSQELVDQLVAAKIRMSIVCTFRVRVSELRAAAKATGGTYYLVDDPYQIPSIFIDEAKALKRSFLRNKEFIPTADPSSRITAGLGPFPKLTGYVVTTSKGPPAVSVLTASPESKEFNSLPPILSIWPHGQAKVAAFTSNFTDWGDAWQKWDGLQTFVQRLVSEISRDSSLGVSTHVTDQTATITVDELKPGGSNQPVEATLVGPDRKSKTITLERTQPHQYQGTFPLWDNGRYQVLARRSNGEATDAGVGGFGFVASYSPEHLQLHSDRRPLEQLATLTGGRVLSGEVARDAVFAEDSLIRRTSLSSFDWMLIALAISIPLVEIARRLAIQIPELWHQITQPKFPSNQTLTALLKTKQWVNNALSHKGTARLLVQIWSPAPRPPAKPKAAKPDLDPKSSTIEKLLAMKAQQK